MNAPFRVYFTAAALLLTPAIATADTFLIRSADGGLTWTDIDPGPPYNYLNGFGQGPASAYYLWTDDDVLAYSEPDKEWKKLSRLSGTSAMAWYVDPVNAGTIYLVRRTGPGVPLTLLKTTDDGKTAVDVPTNLKTCPYVSSFVVDPKAPSTMYLVGCNDSLMKSVDGGRTWSFLCAAHGVAVDPADASIVYVRYAQQFLKSVDGGHHWSTPFLPGFTLWSRNQFLAFDPGDRNVLYAIAQNGEIWKSADRGDNWNLLSPPLESFRATALFLKAGNPSTLFAQGVNGIFHLLTMQSKDGGATWSTFLEGDIGEFDLQFDRNHGETVYGFNLWSRTEPRLTARQAFARDLLGRPRIVPGGIVAIYGGEFAPDSLRADSLPLPNRLLGAEVRFNNQPAPLFFVSPGQINAQVPFGLREGPVTLEVRHPDGTSERQTVSVTPSAPFILTDEPQGKGAGLYFHGSDFRRVTPADPAHPGETLVLYAVGFGEVSPAIAAGVPPPSPPPVVSAKFYLMLYGAATDGSGLWVSLNPAVRWAGYAPGLVGVYQVNFELPPDIRPGKFTLTLPCTADTCVGPILDVR